MSWWSDFREDHNTVAGDRTSVKLDTVVNIIDSVSEEMTMYRERVNFSRLFSFTLILFQMLWCVLPGHYVSIASKLTLYKEVEDFSNFAFFLQSCIQILGLCLGILHFTRKTLTVLALLIYYKAVYKPHYLCIRPLVNRCLKDHHLVVGGEEESACVSLGSAGVMLPGVAAPGCVTNTICWRVEAGHSTIHSTSRILTQNTLMFANGTLYLARNKQPTKTNNQPNKQKPKTTHTHVHIFMHASDLFTFTLLA